MKKICLSLLILMSILTFSGCMPNRITPTQNVDNNSVTQTQPTLSEDDDLDTIKKELEDTDIPQEDFSELEN